MSATTATFVTSEPVPLVVGIAISRMRGADGSRRRRNSRISFAESMALPPPIATTVSPPKPPSAATPRATLSIGGSGTTSEYTECSAPQRDRRSVTCEIIPLFTVNGSATTNTRCPFNSSKRSSASSPKYTCGWMWNEFMPFSMAFSVPFVQPLLPSAPSALVPPLPVKPSRDTKENPWISCRFTPFRRPWTRPGFGGWM